VEDAIVGEAMGHAATTTAPARLPMSRFVDDSPLEGEGFEPSVPRGALPGNRFLTDNRVFLTWKPANLASRMTTIAALGSIPHPIRIG
jgi:hypothetical protein